MTPEEKEHMDRLVLKERARVRGLLRDKFALAALNGFIANGEERERSVDKIAQDSYRLADAMLDARSG